MTAEGALVAVAGLVRGMRHTGMPQLQISSIAPAGLSDDLLARRRVAKRIETEGLSDLRRTVALNTRLIRRAAVIGSPTGFQDVRHGYLSARHLPPPATCYHQISPQSDTAVIDVPRLIAGHVDAGVDAILIAFGGHLPVPSPWDTESIVDAIVDAHRAGVIVLAGFAHAEDQPLAKRVAVDLKQASAAARRLVARNDERVEPLFAIPRVLPTAVARHDEQRRRVLQAGGRAASQSIQARVRAVDQLARQQTGVARQLSRTRREELERLVAVGRATGRVASRLDEQEARLARAARTAIRATGTRQDTERRRLTVLGRAASSRLTGRLTDRQTVLATQPPRVVAGLRGQTGVRSQTLATAAARTAALLAGRVERAAGELRSTSLVSQMLHRGSAMVATGDGAPAADPAVGDRIVVQTVASRFEAVVDTVEGDHDG